MVNSMVEKKKVKDGKMQVCEVNSILGYIVLNI